MSETKRSTTKKFVDMGLGELLEFGVAWGMILGAAVCIIIAFFLYV